MLKRIGVILLVAIGGASCLEFGEQSVDSRRLWTSSLVPRPQLAAP